MNSKASNSVMTRVRAKYGCRLKTEDYESLAGAQSIKEVVNFMKSRKGYAEHFENLASDTDLHRLKVERALQSAFETEAMRLCGFEKNVGYPFLKYMDIDRETELILDYIVNLSFGTPHKMILKIPSKSNSGTKVDFSRLFQITNVAELSKYLSKTKYAKLVSVLPKNEGDTFDISLIEATLGKIKYGMVFSEIRKTFSPETAEFLSSGFLMRSELSDIDMIYRAKKYYNLSPSYIRTNLVGYRYLLSAAVFDRLIEAESADEFMNIFRKSRYASRIQRIGIEDVELFRKKAVVENEIRQIHFSADPAVVLSAYLRFLETECENIIKIIEGITYKVPKEDILKNLIVTKGE